MTARLVALLLASGLIAAACSSGDSVLDAGLEDEAPAATESTGDVGAGDDGAGDDGASDGGADTAPVTEVAPTTTVVDLADLPPCAPEALEAADGPVEVTFWYGLAAELEDAVDTLVDQYNAAQDRVVVDAINQASYDSIIEKYTQASQASRPDVTMFPEYALREIAGSDTIVPVGACIEATGFDTAPFLARTLSAYATEGVQWGMPFNVSVPILYYNRSVFEAAGLDPEVPPVSFDDLRSMSEQIVASGAATYGIALDSGADSGGGWFLEQWLGRAGAPYSDNGNGRLAPSTEVLFDGPEAVDALTAVQSLVDEGLATYVGVNAGGQDGLLKMADANEPAAMAIATSAALRQVLNLLSSGLVPGLPPDALGVAALPGPTVQPGSQVGGASLWIVDKDPDVVAAVWDFITFLAQPQSQSTWASSTGYVPIRNDAIDLDPLATTYAEDPRFQVAFGELLARADDITANAPALGPQRQIRAITAEAVAAILTGADVTTTLTDAAAAADDQLDAWNRPN